MAVERSKKLKDTKLGSRVGTIVQTGCLANGTSYVLFNSGAAWASLWPEWAQEVAHKALLHGKSVRVIYQGPAPYGENLVAKLLTV